MRGLSDHLGNSWMAFVIKGGFLYFILEHQVGIYHIILLLLIHEGDYEKL